MENWKPISGHEGFYEVSDHGRIKSLERKIWCKRGDGYYRIVSPRFLCPVGGGNGYPTVGLFKDGITTKWYVHTLVLTHFVGERPEGMECCHCDGDKNNNKVTNLRWDTRGANLKDNWDHGKMDATRGREGRPKDWLSWSDEEKAEYNRGIGERSKAVWAARSEEERKETARKISENTSRRTPVEITFADGTIKVYRGLSEARAELGCKVKMIRNIIDGYVSQKHTWTARYV